MNAYIYLMVVCIYMAPGQTRCMQAGPPFVGDNAAQICKAMEDKTNKTAPPNFQYYCVRRQVWGQP